MHPHVGAVRDGDAGRLLAPMLEREETEVGEVGDVDPLLRADPENPAHLDQSAFPSLTHLVERQPKLPFELERVTAGKAQQGDLDVVAARKGLKLRHCTRRQAHDEMQRCRMNLALGRSGDHPLRI